MMADIDKKIMNVVRKTCTESRKISVLKDVKIGKQFEDDKIELVDLGLPNLWGYFKN